MAKRVHPADLVAPELHPPPSERKLTFDSGEYSLPRSSPPPLPPPSYVVQVPKDAILRVPPPENARRYKKLSRPRRSCSCCRVLCWLIGILLLLAGVIAIAGAVFYLVFRPKTPSFSIDSLSVKGFDISKALFPSPEFDLYVRAENPNKKIGIFYERGSDVSVSFSGDRLVSGEMPAFYQGTRNVTVFPMVLAGSNVQLSSAVHLALIQAHNDGRVPLFVSLDVPVKLKVGSVKTWTFTVKTWTFTVKVRCDVAVDKLTVNSKIVSKQCEFSVKM